MPERRRPVLLTPRWEWAAAATLLASILFVAARGARQGRLGDPFYDWPNGTLMDLYSTAWWAHHGGAYDAWRSIYPPLAFVLLKLTTLSGCYVASAEAARDCDWLGRAALLATFAFNFWLLWRLYRKTSPASAWARAAIVGAGLPMLYALERGNLLIPCFTALALGVGSLVTRPLFKWLALAVAINLKPYLLAVILSATARRDWRWLAGLGTAGLAVYLGSWLILREGSPAVLLGDMARYAPGKAAAIADNLHYATSFWPLARALNGGDLGWLVTSGPLAHGLASGLVLLMRAAQIGAGACFAAALARPSRIDNGRFLALYGALILTTITNGSAGYAQIFIFLLIGLEPARGWLRIGLLACAFLLSLPLDVAIGPDLAAPAWSWLGQRLVEAPHRLTVGQLLRPALLMAIQFILIALNLADSFGAELPNAKVEPDARAVAGVS